ncbi:MAG TPA: tyrosine-protein phosphatase [Candidatus Eubacterium faecipullorum]|uniref:Tyrosine-protein phosphatase n=1 Tax=Candidatus Eubacterium faecipullorum TaxID=2838571 RepID=A0A9D1UHE0_9FIRM|nr:tyrosine-protein phosphatase [Candidatus Eubacterium faecipullorum]
MKYTIRSFAAVLAVLILFAGCSAGGTDSTAEIKAVSPVDETVGIHTFSQSAFLFGPDALIGTYAYGQSEKSRPKPVEFEWRYSEDDDTQFTLRISESEDMADAASYTTGETQYSVYNLKIGTEYFWTVSAGGITSEVYSFTTDSDAPRNLYIDGVTNARDIGGRETENGTVTKQGMIYRCGRLNESNVPYVNIEITEDGKRTMLEELGVKTEIDVRLDYDSENGGITESPLGSSVTYINCPMEWDGKMLGDNKEQVVQVFSILADENNYPLFIHCNIGTDRTGMISFMINALLGVPEEELYDDFLFSNFGNIGGKRPLEKLLESDYYTAIMQSEGNTLSEKTYNCLVDTGVPAEDLDALIEIMTA